MLNGIDNSYDEKSIRSGSNLLEFRGRNKFVKHNLRTMSEAKSKSRPLTWLTCYDYSFASVLAETDLDLILVGDSGGMVALGYTDTVPVTMDEMIMLTSAVRRGARNKFIVGDMPKGSYEVSDDDAVRNAMRFVKESGADAVKLEGGVAMSERIEAITKSGIPVFGHIGLTPQSAVAHGGYRVVGRESKEGDRVLQDATAVQEAGAVAVLLEALPPRLSKSITEKLTIPVLGIGAGPFVDGQLLILHDLLGLYPDFRPKFAQCFVPKVTRNFLESFDNANESARENRRDGIRELARLAVCAFILDTVSGHFPGTEYSYSD